MNVCRHYPAWMRYLLGTTLALFVLATPTPGQEVVDRWRYALSDPGDGWRAAVYDTSGWFGGEGGFGTAGTSGARIGVDWTGEQIWLRKTYKLDSPLQNPALLIHHDEDATVSINGVMVADLVGYTTEYRVVPIPADKRHAIHPGRNVLAVYCRQESGGQFIDAHLISADARPELPAMKRATKPFQSQLITEWGEGVTPDNAWTEYPRPQMRRSEWTNLNGTWRYAITEEGKAEAPAEMEGDILVPFGLESKLSGVQRLLDPTEALWYRRRFTATPRSGERRLLHFEAVDYDCRVFVNGAEVGSHRGGSTPFHFDITESLRAGENELVVRVEDDTESFQLRGKQMLNPRGIWYTQVSGIWQTVWLETVPTQHINDLKVSTDADGGTITVAAELVGATDSSRLRVRVLDSGQVVAEEIGASMGLTIDVEDAKLWSPASPHLYDLEVSLLDADANQIDLVESYAGIRSVGKARDSDGHLRFTLNGEELFHWGTLDQGWWPDGLLTPPSDEAMLFDIEWLKRAGFNMIRKHIKVEPRRYYYHCDRLGMLVWQDQVSGGPSPEWTRLKPDARDAVWPEDQHQQYLLEHERMVDTLENHPSIAVWVPFNERWGQHRTMKVGEWMTKRDPSRLTNIASGGNFWPVGDIVDAHKYPHPDFPYKLGLGGRFDDYIKVVGEFGGHGYPHKEHLWDPSRRNWGYGGLPKTTDEYEERYVTSLSKLKVLRRRGVAGGVYTQTTDVEGEINGLLTYDRKVIKISAKRLSELHRQFLDMDATATPAAASVDALLDEPNPAFRSTKTDRKPGPVMDAATIQSGLKSHDRALYIKSGWIRDPYITLGPDDLYYLTGTQPNPGDPRERTEPYNTGLGSRSIVGEHVRVWRSPDLIKWESFGEPFGTKDTYQMAVQGKQPRKRLVWAPEVHWLGDRWALVHCPKQVASLALSAGPGISGPWTHPMGDRLGPRHDPSLFQDDNGKRYLLWENTLVAQLSEDFTSYVTEPVRIDPAGSRPGPDGQPISRIGHEGATMLKVGGKYVHLGTAWSTDQMRKGSYNLYYCVADQITGPYGPRNFAGRFLGHGTPFQDRDGKWWCTAFFNGNLPPVSREGVQQRDLSETAQTINEQGVTIVPLDVKLLDSGEVYIRAKDPAYATPGPDESQNFKD